MKLLDDHPLSLELVGPYLKTLSPETICTDYAKILAEIDQAAKVRPDGTKERNSSPLASLEFSRRHLSPAAREALPWLGLFSGGVFEDNLLDISQITLEAWVPIRRELESIALVRAEAELKIGGRPFLRFHPTLASATADGSLSQQPELRQRYIEVYLAVMKMLAKMLEGSQSRAALAIFDCEEANFRTAVHWAIDDLKIREAASLAYTFNKYLERSGRFRERDAWVTMLKDATKVGPFTEEAVAYEYHDAYRRFQQGDPQGAVKQIQALIDRLRSTTEFDPAFQLALSIGALGDMLNDCGASSQAIPYLQEAIRLWEIQVEKVGLQSWKSLLATGDHAKAAFELGNLSATMGNLANALRAAGLHDEALDVAEKCVRIQTICGNQRSIAAGHGRCAEILMNIGRLDEADARYELALAAARLAGGKNFEGSLLQHQGGLARLRGDFTRSVNLSQHALLRFQDAGDKPSIMRTYIQLGLVERNFGRLAEARAWYEKSRLLAVELKDQHILGAAAQNIGIVCQLEGDAAHEQGNEPAARSSFQAALRCVEESLRIKQALGNKPGEASSHGQLAQIHVRLGDLAAAEHHAHEARQTNDEIGLKEVWRNYGTLSEIAEARGDAAAAADWAQKRDAKLAELKRLAGGGGGLSSKMLEALQALMIACAQAGFGDAPLSPDEKEALVTLDGYPPPFSEFSAALR